MLELKELRLKEISEHVTEIASKAKEISSLKSEITSLQQQVLNSQMVHENLEEEIKRLENANDNLKAMSAECKICFAERISVALSCGHTICENCFQKVFMDQSKKCPFCKQKYLGLQFLFLE